MSDGSAKTAFTLSLPRQVVLKRSSLPRRLHVAPAPPAQVLSRGTFLIAIYIIKISVDWKKNFSHLSLVATFCLG